jgi:hypothetical protein
MMHLFLGKKKEKRKEKERKKDILTVF